MGLLRHLQTCAARRGGRGLLTGAYARTMPGEREASESEPEPPRVRTAATRACRCRMTRNLAKSVANVRLLFGSQWARGVLYPSPEYCSCAGRLLRTRSSARARDEHVSCRVEGEDTDPEERARSTGGARARGDRSRGDKSKKT